MQKESQIQRLESTRAQLVEQLQSVRRLQLFPKIAANPNQSFSGAAQVPSQENTSRSYSVPWTHALAWYQHQRVVESERAARAILSAQNVEKDTEFFIEVKF